MAGDLLHAIAMRWGENKRFERYRSLSSYVAKVAGKDATSFNCDDLTTMNACATYAKITTQSTCVSSYAIPHVSSS